MNTVLRQIATLFRQPRLVLSAVFVLALGIGINIAMFTVLNQVLLRPLPYPESQKLVMIYASSPLQGFNTGVASLADLIDMKRQTHSFTDLTGYANFPCSLPRTPRADQSEQVRCTYTTANLFTALRQPALVGRPFLTGDDDPNHPTVALLGEGLWKRRYGGDPNVIGQVLNVSGTPYQIVGVMPASFQYPKNDIELWLTIPLTTPASRDPFYLRIIGRLREGTSLEQGRADLAAFAAGLERSYPKVYSQLKFPLLPLQDALVGNVRSTLWILQCLVLLVLLITQTNVAGLLLVRTFRREREIAIRLSLGATHRHLMQGAAIESATLSLLGGALGIGFAAICLHLLRRFAPQTVFGVGVVKLDATAVFLALALSVLTAGLIGALPVWRGFSSTLSDALRESGSLNSTLGRSKRYAREALLVAEIVVCFVLVLSAGILLRTLSAMESVDLGFHTPPEKLLSMQINPSGVFDPQQRVRFYRQLLSEIQSLPGVRSAAVTASLPPDRTTFTMPFEVEGRPKSPGQQTPSVTVPLSSPRYFETLGIPLVRGRFFTSADTLQTRRVAIISQRLASQYFPNQDPIGKRIRDDTDRPWIEIVGIVGDVKYSGVTSELEPVFYYPADQEVGQSWSYLVLRADRPDTLIHSIQDKLAKIDRDATVSHFSRMDQAQSSALAQPRFRALLMTMFAALAVLLTMVGIFSIVSFQVSERKREIGISLALGATHRFILLRLLRRSLLLAACGILIGLVISLPLGHLYHSLLFGIHDNDVFTLAAATLMVLAASQLATLVSVRSINKMQPSDVLRAE